MITVDHELNEKLEAMIAEKQPGAMAAVAQIRDDADNLNDFIAPIGFTNSGMTGVNFSSNGIVKAHAGEVDYKIHQHAIGQFGDKLGIPTRYLKTLSGSLEQWARDLAAHSLNESAKNIGRKRLLIRTIGDEIRGVLSDSYRRMDTGVILSQFLAACDDAGAIIFDAKHTDTKSFVEVILPQPFDIQTENNGKLGLVFGMQISSSDYGDGALKVSSFLVNGACWNGMLFKSSINQIHLGRRLPDDINFAQDTYEADTLAQARAVRDVTKTLMGKDRILQLATGIKEATEIKIDNIDNEIRKLSRLGSGMAKGELLLVEEKLKYNREEDGLAGGLTKWKLANAVTAVARDNEDGRRKRELEEIGGLLLGL